MMVVVIPLFICVISGALGLVTEDTIPAFTHHAGLDPDGKYTIAWLADKEKMELVVSLTCATRGWLGFGVSTNGAMRGADMVTAWVDDAGKPFVQDQYGEGNFLPAVDTQNDWRILQASENSSHTVMVLARAFDTCDPHDLPFTNATKRFIYAWGEEDPGSNLPENLLYHGPRNRGSRYAFMLQPSPSTGDNLPADVKTWRFGGNMIIQKHRHTLYWCNIIEAPQMSTQIHYIGYDMKHGQNSLQYLHHVVVFECSGDPDENEKLHNYTTHGGHECYTENMPQDFTQCKAALVVWAVGGEGDKFPKYAGYPLLTEPGRRTFFLVEAHYDNQPRDHGVEVDWNIDIFYTQKLREYDAGNFLIGHNLNFGHVVPPRQKHWLTSGHCPRECLQEVLPEEGIKVFMVFLHAHTLGRKLRVRHFRNGEELPPMAVDDNYDFNFQQTAVLDQERTVFPEDHITLECDYDSRSQHDNVTYAGFAAVGQEMCLAFLMYYPRIPMAECVSAPHPEILKKVFDIDQFDHEEELYTFNANHEALNPYLPNKGVQYQDWVNRRNWDDMNMTDVNYQMARGPHLNRCLKRGGIPAHERKPVVKFPVAKYYTYQAAECPSLLHPIGKEGLSEAYNMANGNANNNSFMLIAVFYIFRYTFSFL
ncbi:unnamed protein product [Meganyctiphanes norvegica]|uniref:DOMON domain-containing protein n=1 Tax=Meganyctiphanes norvegica TaxID=48144 RepID=A0AAV2RQH0_MEGNR